MALHANKDKKIDWLIIWSDGTYGTLLAHIQDESDNLGFGQSIPLSPFREHHTDADHPDYRNNRGGTLRP